MLYLIRFDIIYHSEVLGEEWRFAFPKIIGWVYGNRENEDWYYSFLGKTKIIE